MFKEMDKNQDGTLTHTEFNKYVKKQIWWKTFTDHGKGPDGSFHWAEFWEEYERLYVKHQMGQINLDEFTASYKDKIMPAMGLKVENPIQASAPESSKKDPVWVKTSGKETIKHLFGDQSTKQGGSNPNKVSLPEPPSLNPVWVKTSGNPKFPKSLTLSSLILALIGPQGRQPSLIYLGTGSLRQLPKDLKGRVTVAQSSRNRSILSEENPNRNPIGNSNPNPNPNPNPRVTARMEYT